MPLPVVERAGDERHAAGVVELEAAHFLVRRRRDLEIAADAEPTQAPALLRLFAPLRKAFCGLHRLLEYPRKVAAVERHPRRRLPRDLARPHVVAPAELEPI